MLQTLLVAMLVLQQPDPADAQELPVVVVTASSRAERVFALPASATVVTRDELVRARPAIDPSEALARVPGLRANNRRNFAQDTQIVLRGYGARATFGVRGVRLYVNGIPASAADGQGQLSHAALGGATRIEVLRGPLAALYGNASGGTIRIETDPRALGSGVAAAAAASADFVRLAAGYRASSPRAAIALDASHLDYQGFRPRSSARRDVLDAVAGGELGGAWRWTVVANAFRSPADDPLGLTGAELAQGRDRTTPVALQFDTRKDSRQDQAGIALSREPGDGIGARIAAYGGAREVVQFLSVPPSAQAAPSSAGGVIDLARDYGGVELRGWRAFGPLTLTLGANADRVAEDRRGYENFVGATLGVRGTLRRDERNRVDARDVLALAEWQLCETWLASAGWRRSELRYSSHDRFIAPGNPDDSGRREFSANVPFVALRFAPNERLAVHAAWARGFEAPTLNELSYRTDGSAGLNATLEPMRSRQLELGAKWRARSLALEAAVFEDQTRGEIVTARNAGGRASFANAARTRRRGAELGMQAELGHALTLALSVTVLDARYRDAFFVCRAAPCTTPATRVAAGSRMPAIPRRWAHAELGWRVAPAWRLGVEAQGASSVVVDDVDSERAAGYGTLALSVTRTWAAARGTLEAWARIENVSDREYAGSVIVNEANGRYFEPVPGRTLMLGLSWSPR